MFWDERLLNFIRGIVRPAVTISLLVGAMIMISYGVEVPEWIQTLAVSAVSFYFGTRNGAGPK